MNKLLRQIMANFYKFLMILMSLFSYLFFLILNHNNIWRNITSVLSCSITAKSKQSTNKSLELTFSSQRKTLNSGQLDNNISSVRIFRGIMANFYKFLMILMSLFSYLFCLILNHNNIWRNITSVLSCSITTKVKIKYKQIF